MTEEAQDKVTPKAHVHTHGPGCSHDHGPGQDHGHETFDPSAMYAGKQPVFRTEPKVGRNDPCPCGSGKKYKKCHGA